MFENWKATRPTIRSTHGAVSAGHYLATAAGIRILAMGGNAFDAGVGAGLCLNVVHSDMCTMTGVAPVILFDAKRGRVFSLAGVGTWGQNVDVSKLKAKYANQRIDWPDNTVVPAAFDAWITILRDHGTLTFRDVVLPALEYAENGYPVSDFQNFSITHYLDNYNRWSENRSIFLVNGEPPPVGTRIVQKDLTKTLRTLMRVEERHSSQGRGAALTAVRDEFYKGEIGKTLVAFGREAGGVLTVDDFARYQVEYEPPFRVTFQGLEVYSCGPWCQGPVLLQALQFLNALHLETVDNPADIVHFMIESLKMAFWDRHAYYGDPRFIRVPMKELLSSRYAKERVKGIDPQSAISEWLPGEVLTEDHPDPFQGLADTSYVAVIDEHLNVFSATPSDGYSQGGICPGLGLHISERGAQGSLNANDPNYVQPFKRPRLTPNPSLVQANGMPYLVVGTPGNDRQPQAMLQVLLNMVLFGLEPQEAVEVPRLASFSFPASTHPHSTFPNVLYVEENYPHAIVAQLAERGHDIHLWPPRHWQAGGVCVIHFNPQERVFESAADNRRDGYAIGF